MTTPQRTIKITGQPTAQPHVCQFAVDHPIYPGGTVNCRNAEMAKDSPLLEALFAIDGIQQIMLHENIITIDKSSDEPWTTLGKKIGAVIRETILSGNELFSPKLLPDALTEHVGPEAMRQQIKVLLTNTINPAVADHGGVVELVDVKDNDVYLHMGGGCQGCGAASFTLQMSVERILRSHLPQIRKIIDTTDHSAGSNPYY